MQYGSKSFYEAACATLMIASLVMPAQVWANEACKNYENTSQRATYCEAAKDLDDAADGQKKVAFIQAGAAAVCLAACTSVVGTIDMGWCRGASIGATASTLFISKDIMQSAASGLGTIASFYAVNAQTAQNAAQGAANLANFKMDLMVYKDGDIAKEGGAYQQAQGDQATQQKNADQAGEKKDGLCYATAALHGFTSFMSFKGSKDSKEDAEQNRKVAADLLASETAQADRARREQNGGATIQAPQGGVVPPGFERNPMGFKSGSQGGSLGGFEGGGRGSFEKFVNFAVAQPGSNLPPFVRSPAFRAELERMSGMSADQLVAMDDPGRMMQASLGRVLNPEGQSRLGAVLSQMKDYVSRQVSTAPNRLAGRPELSRDPRRPDEVLSPTAAPRSPAGMSAQEDLVPVADRLLASVAGDEENPTISIFVRVSSRYQLAWGKDHSHE